MQLTDNDHPPRHKRKVGSVRTEPSESSESSHNDSTISSVDLLNGIYSQRYIHPDSIYNRLQKAIFDKPNFLGNSDSIHGVNASYDSKNGNASFYKGKDVLTLLVFGELAPMHLGTRITAVGNHYPWGEPVSAFCYVVPSQPYKPVSGKLSVKERIKWILALQEPSMSTPEVSRAYSQQCDVLNQLLVMCERGREMMKEALSRGQVRSPASVVSAFCADHALLNIAYQAVRSSCYQHLYGQDHSAVHSRSYLQRGEFRRRGEKKVLRGFLRGSNVLQIIQTSQSILGEDEAPDAAADASGGHITVQDARSKVSCKY